MRRKFFFMSLMLMGLVSLFTSCVDVDYYDLYDDEEEILSPRSKKGKDLPGDGLYYTYSMMGDGWYEAECVACCYSNIYGTDNPTSRYLTIVAAYGEFNGETVSQYFNSVMHGGGVFDAAPSLFGSDLRDAGDLARSCVENNLTDLGGKVAVYSKNFRHIAKVTGVSYSQHAEDGGYDVYFEVVDNNNCTGYTITLNKKMKRKSKNTDGVECFLFCK